MDYDGTNSLPLPPISTVNRKSGDTKDNANDLFYGAVGNVVRFHCAGRTHKGIIQSVNRNSNVETDTNYDIMDIVSSHEYEGIKYTDIQPLEPFETEMQDFSGSSTSSSNGKVLTPECADASKERGNILFKLKDYDSALSYYEEALKNVVSLTIGTTVLISENPNETEPKASSGGNNNNSTIRRNKFGTIAYIDEDDKTADVIYESVIPACGKARPKLGASGQGGSKGADSGSDASGGWLGGLVSTVQSFAYGESKTEESDGDGSGEDEEEEEAKEEEEEEGTHPLHCLTALSNESGPTLLQTSILLNIARVYTKLSLPRISASWCSIAYLVLYHAASSKDSRKREGPGQGREQGQELELELKEKQRKEIAGEHKEEGIAGAHQEEEDVYSVTLNNRMLTARLIRAKAYVNLGLFKRAKKDLDYVVRRGETIAKSAKSRVVDVEGGANSKAWGDVVRSIKATVKEAKLALARDCSDSAIERRRKADRKISKRVAEWVQTATSGGGDGDNGGTW